MGTPDELRVFISSTFRDLQEEREHLVKKIFPEIRALCRERGITFTEVDLRWGVTEEQLALGQVIRTCLEEVDKCRPYFIGITGTRYGFIPTYLDIQKDPALLEQYSWIEDAALDGMSITEMEAQYAVLNASLASTASNTSMTSIPHDRAHFYFRRHRESLDDAHTNDKERTNLEAYQHRIRQSGVPVAEFRDPVALGALIYDDLVAIINRDFADARPPTPLDQERARHEAFSLSRRRAYIANPLYLKRLNDHAGSNDPPLVVYAESGSGKSSLCAYWAEQYRRKHPEAHVIEHYVGIGATATDHYAIIQHVCMEIKERFSREEDLPANPRELDTAFGQWLGYADRELTRADEHMVVILDGLNQLRGAALSLSWIPDATPDTVRLVLTTTVEDTLVQLQKRGWGQFGMQALSEAERETIIVRYLAEFRKSLSGEQITRIATDYKCGHPLFLKTLVEELRLVGRHEDLDSTIASYLSTTGTEDLFQRVLERLEDDHDVQAARDVMSLVCASRGGLDERELSEISGIGRLQIASMITGLDYHLVRKEGHLTFFHDYLRRAVEKRYLSDELQRRRAHQRIADYFQNAELNLRNATERMWGYAQAGDDTKLVQTLSDPEALLLLRSHSGASEVTTHWSRLRDEGHDPEVCCREGLDRIRDNCEFSHFAELTFTVVRVLEEVGVWTGALDLARNILSAAIECRDHVSIARADQLLGWQLLLRGEHDEALERLAHGLEEFEQLAKPQGVAEILGTMGQVYVLRTEFSRALEVQERALKIYEEIGDRGGIAIIMEGMGTVFGRLGDLDRAQTCFERDLAIWEEVGNLQNIATAVGNLGTIHYLRDEYDRALSCFKHWLKTSRELGHRTGVATAIGNMGLVFDRLGEHDRAVECYQQQLEICQELGEPRGAADAMGNMGYVYLARNEYAPALRCLQQATVQHQSLGDRHGVAHWLRGTANVFLDLAVTEERTPEYVTPYLPADDSTLLRAARHYVEQAASVAAEFSTDGDFSSERFLLARVDAAEGKLEAARIRLLRMLETCNVKHQRAEILYWLWKLGLDTEKDHRDEAEQLYTEMIASRPNNAYQEKLNELRAGAGMS